MQCSLCEYEAPGVLDLKHHYLTAHRKHMCAAPNCGSVLGLAGDLKHHIAELHEHRRWQCLGCGLIHRRRNMYIHWNAHSKCKAAGHKNVYMAPVGKLCQCGSN